MRPAGWRQSRPEGSAPGIKNCRSERRPKPGVQQHSVTPRDFSKPAATSSIPQATAATAAAGKPPRYPGPDATAPGGGEKTPPTRAQGCGPAALAQPLRRMTRSSTAAVACGLHYCGPPPQAVFPNGRLRPVGSENRSTRALAGQAAQPLAPNCIPLLVQAYARRSRHGAGPPLPSAALPH